jgi:hypothetical protein
VSFAHQSQPPGVAVHGLLSGLDYADAGHTGFCSLATAQTIEAQKLIDSTVGLRFGHATGPLLKGAGSGDDLTLTGEFKVKPAPAGGAGNTYALQVEPTTNLSGWSGAYYGLYVNLPYGDGTPVGNARGALFATAIVLASGKTFKYLESGGAGVNLAAAAASGYVHGLDFTPRVAAPLGTTLTELTAVKLGVYVGASAGAITAIRGMHIKNLAIPNVGPVGTMAAIDVEDFSGTTVTNVIGLRIADPAYGAGTRYLLEIGPAVVRNLRLVAGAPPDAGLATEGDSQLFLAWMENAVVVGRRVRWRQQASLLATDKVLIAA